MTVRLFRFCVIAMVVALPATAISVEAPKPAAPTKQASQGQIARGRYMVVAGGCSDCHTAGYPERDGKVNEAEWLLGGTLGFYGPWGTTYAPNLRMTVSRMTEAEWVSYARALKTRPPMPWFNLNKWSESDLRAVYQYVRTLSPVGKAAPAYLPPDKQPNPPFLQWPAPPK